MALPPQQKSNNRSGSGFTNLNRYLQANQSNRLGNTVSAGVERAGGDARSALTQANQDFQAKAADENARLVQQGSRVNQVLGNVANTTDEDVKQFEDIRNATSKGPEGVADANALRAKAGEAEMLGRAGGSEAGRFGLLQRFVGGGRPQYNAGNQRLDQMLLGQTGQQQLRGARASTQGLGAQADQQIGGASAQGEELKGKARQLAESTIGQLGGAATGYDAEMQQRLADKKAMINSILSGVDVDANKAIDVDEAMLKNLSEASGGILGEGTTLYKSDISPFVNLNELYATKQGVQGQSDFGRAKNLGRLSGNSLAGKDAGNTLQDYLGREDMVGSFDANNPFSVTSRTGLNDAILKAKKDYDDAVGAKQGEMGNLIRGLAVAAPGEYYATGGKIGAALQSSLFDPASVARKRMAELEPRIANRTVSSQEQDDYDRAKMLVDRSNMEAAADPNRQTAMDRIKQAQEGHGSFLSKVHSVADNDPSVTAMQKGGSSYLNNLISPELLDAALAMPGGTGIQSDLDAIKENEARQEAFKSEFNTLRQLKKRAPVVPVV